MPMSGHSFSGNSDWTEVVLSPLSLLRNECLTKGHNGLMLCAIASCFARKRKPDELVTFQPSQFRAASRFLS